MSKHDEAELILKLYDLRREATMRIARDWYFLEFNPESVEDVTTTFFGEHSAHLRMVFTYWDMAAALVKHGAISPELFGDTNGEHLSVFAKLEPFLPELRASFGPQLLANLEALVDSLPGGRERTAMIRERMKGLRAQIAQQRAKAAAQS